MQEKTMMYDNLPPVRELNMVPGFDARRFLTRRKSEAGDEVLYLDLKYRKLWFRLKYPHGRIRVKTMLINEQVAIFEAKLFLHKDDTEPVSTFTAQRFSHGKLSHLYVDAAQYEAISHVLDDAGFGLQFCDVSRPADAELLGRSIPVAKVTEEAGPAPAEVPPVQDRDKEQGAEPPVAVQVPPPPVDTALPVTPPVATPAVETPAAQIAETEPAEQPEQTPIMAEETTDTPSATPTYSADMSVEEILAVMTVEEAEAVVVDVGTCNGWSLAEVAERRPASLKWYVSGYTGSNNLIRAGAKLLLDRGLELMAS